MTTTHTEVKDVFRSLGALAIAPAAHAQSGSTTGTTGGGNGGGQTESNSAGTETTSISTIQPAP